jgi:hypothetical protein
MQYKGKRVEKPLIVDTIYFLFITIIYYKSFLPFIFNNILL